MMKYRKKPLDIEAIRFDGKNGAEIELWSNGKCKVMEFYGLRSVQIQTLDGVMRADAGDWCAKGIKGEFYPIKNDIFLTTYERVES